MLIILTLFQYIQVIFWSKFNKSIKDYNNGILFWEDFYTDIFTEIKLPNYLINEITKFYLENNIDLSNSNNLQTLYKFDDKVRLYISGHDQEVLLKRTRIDNNIQNLTLFIIKTIKYTEFIFRWI